MKKLVSILFVLSIVFAGSSVFAQNASGEAQQKVELALSGVMDITFAYNNSNTGNTVTLAFNNVNDYLNGVESPAQTLRVRANKQFDILVESSSDVFSYSGNAGFTPSMKVDKVLEMKIIENNTGGTITGGFQNYQKISDNDKKMINKGDPGADQNFTVQYKADPGFEFPAGIYSADIIFTVTEH